MGRKVKMQKGFSLITGVAKIRITGRKPERALNRLTEEDIKFKSLKRISEDTIELAIRGMNYPAAERFAGPGLKSPCSPNPAFRFLRRFKKIRAVFAPIISIVAAFYLSFSYGSWRLREMKPYQRAKSWQRWKRPESELARLDRE